MHVVSVSVALAGLSILSTGQASPSYGMPSLDGMDTPSDLVTDQLTKVPTASDKAVITNLSSTADGMPLLLNQHVSTATAQNFDRTVRDPILARENWRRAVDEYALATYAIQDLGSGDAYHMGGQSCSPKGCSKGFSFSVTTPLPGYVRGLNPLKGSPMWQAQNAASIFQSNYQQLTMDLAERWGGNRGAPLPAMFKSYIPEIDEYYHYLVERNTDPDAKPPAWLTQAYARNAAAEAKAKQLAALEAEKAEIQRETEENVNAEIGDEYKAYLLELRTNPHAKMPTLLATFEKNYETDIKIHDEYEAYIEKAEFDPSYLLTTPPPSAVAKVIETYMTDLFKPGGPLGLGGKD